MGIGQAGVGGVRGRVSREWGWGGEEVVLLGFYGASGFLGKIHIVA